MTARIPSPSPAPDRPHLLLVGCGDQLFREYLLSSLAEQYRVHLFLAEAVSWESRHLDGYTVLRDLTDERELLAAARALAARDRIDGLLCWQEASLIAAAQVSQALGLPGVDAGMVLRCQDKHRTRRLLAVAGVPQPTSILVDSVEQALEAAAEIGYPVVLKPREPAARMDVVLVASEAELTEQFALAGASAACGSEVSVLVEEYADGPEISVDCAVYHGEVLPICLAHKQLGYPPYFEEIGHLVDGADPMLADDSFRDILQQAHAALGFTEGFTHTEFRLTPFGPKLIEVNPRLGGDLIPYLGMRTTGIDPGLVAAAVAVGRRPELNPDNKAFGAVRFCYVPQEMTIGGIGFDAHRMPNGVDRAVVCARPGQRHAPPPAGSVVGRIAYITAIGSSEADVRMVIAGAEAALRVTEVPTIEARAIEARAIEARAIEGRPGEPSTIAARVIGPRGLEAAVRQVS
ncbi:MAG: acetyl-CoA carboxylase biotin carboxylase subunit family protein [Jatrophihabitantaceae bacterium]